MRNAEIYGREYYADNFRNRERYDRLADAIHNAIPIELLKAGTRDAWDIGCGAGLVRDHLRAIDFRITGIDGSTFARADLVVDLMSAWEAPEVRAGAICLEVAEHLPSSSADNLVRIVATAARDWIVWSAAHPGQGGTDHVSERPPEFWLERFVARGWVVDQAATTELRELMAEWNAQHVEYRENFYVLVRA